MKTTMKLKDLQQALIGPQTIESLPDLNEKHEKVFFTAKALLSGLFLKLGKLPNSFSIVKDRVFFNFIKNDNNTAIMLEVNTNVRSLLEPEPKVVFTLTSMKNNNAAMAVKYNKHIVDDPTDNLYIFNSILDVLMVHQPEFKEYTEFTEWEVVRNEKCFSGKVKEHYTGRERLF